MLRICLIALFSCLMNPKPLLIELHFSPCLEYFCMMLRHRVVYLEAHESYLKGSYRNKCKIVTANGTQTLSIPLEKGKHQQKNIQQVKIAEPSLWRRQHWRSLKTAYQSAPYWDDYAPEIEALLYHPADLLWDYNLNLLKGLIEILQLEVELKITSAFVHQAVECEDLRQQLLPKNTQWTRPHTHTISYAQVFEDRQSFVMNASIFDLLFCKGPEASLILEDMLIN